MDPVRGVHVTGGETVSLIGRGAELDELSGLSDPRPASSRVVMVLGDLGIGKTSLIEEVASRARRNGVRVLAAVGRESEAPLAFASLHQLLRPILATEAHRLAAPHRDVLDTIFGAPSATAAADRFAAGVAMLAMLSELAEESAVLVVVEDAQWIDPSSLEVLRFVAHRLSTDPVALVLTAREGELPSSYRPELPVMSLGPLDPADAKQLLERQPHPPRGRLRDQVLAHAAGNPMALIELNRAIAVDPAAGLRWTAAPLPVGDRLSSLMTARLTELPDATQEALLLAAVAGDPDGVKAMTVSGSRQNPELLAPAEELGLIKVGPSGLQFAHPLVRSAVYHAATFSRRAAAHRRLADASRDEPDRYAWHLAAATIGADEHVAELLETSAARAQRREGTAAAVAAMERAAELSENAEDRARRFTQAALLAVLVGQLDLVVDLATRALGVTSDPQLQVTARAAIGFALSLSSRLSEAVEVLLSVASEAAGRGLTYTAWDCLRNAAQAAYFAGTAETREAVRASLIELDAHGSSRLSRRQREDIDCFRLWVRCTTDPFGERDQLLYALHENAKRLEAVPASSEVTGTVERLGVDVASAEQVVAAAAWVLDDCERAIRLLRRIAERLRRPGVRGTSPSVLGLLSLCLFDTGQWDEALEVAAETEDLSIAYRIDIAASAAHITTAQVHALRGDAPLARTYVRRTLSLFDLDQAHIVEARVRRALALADMAEGAYGLALAQLNGLFDHAGRPLHRYESYPGVAELAEAYQRSNARSAGRNRVTRILEAFEGTPSPRLEQIFLRAQAILTDGTRAEHHFRAALTDERGDQWPFERARLYLDFGEWLRRRRRINEAKEFLVLGLETVTRLGAAPSMLRARSELRACGVTVPAPVGVLSDLTPQQQEIVQLAASGMTNQQIADRLYLSPRTVSSHLYRSFPKLGVTARHELAGVLARSTDQQSDPRQ